MSANLRTLAAIIVALIPSIVLTFVLIEIFPYTGLGRIVTIPFTICVNIGIIGLGFLAVRRWGKERSVWIWTAVVVITLVMTVWIYPQEGSPHIVHQTWDWIKGR